MRNYVKGSHTLPGSNQDKRRPGKRLQRYRRQYQWVLLLAGLLFVLFSGVTLAAEIVESDGYTLPRGEVIQDDLYAAGEEVIINGTVEGDLVVAGGYVEINGVVNGDLIGAGGAVVVNGVVQDDARLAGGSVVVAGSIGDDLFAVAGGGWGGASLIPLEFGGRSVTQGLQVTNEATVSGDTYVAGGTLTLAGSFGDVLNAGGSIVNFRGNVAGDAHLYAETLSVSDAAQVQGELRYSTGSDITVPQSVAGTVTREPWSTGEEEEEQTARDILGALFKWLLRTLLVLIGLLLVGWLLRSLAPRQVTQPVAQMEQQPAIAAIYGLLAAVAVAPVSAALVFLAVLFWGWFPGGLVMFAFLFGFFALLWILSPVVTGLWVGRLILRRREGADNELLTLMVGIVAIVLVGRLFLLIPCLGELAYRAVYLASFAIAVGGWIVARRQPASPAQAAGSEGAAGESEIAAGPPTSPESGSNSL